jgi:iron(III) transport system permease protein
MTAEVVALSRRRLLGVRSQKLVVRLALLAFLTGLVYLVVFPLVRLQFLAVEHGGAAYREALDDPGLWRALRFTAIVAAGALAIALVLGTLLAWAAYSLSPRLRLLRLIPILPIFVPSIAAILGWTFMFSPGPGYANELLRKLPWWQGNFDGPLNVYTLYFIILIIGISLTAFMYLFLLAGLENINSEVLEAAAVCGSSRFGVFFRVILPLLRPALVYGGGIVVLEACGAITAPLLLGRQEGIDVLSTKMYTATQLIPPEYGVAAAIASPILFVGLIILLLNRVLLRQNTRFVTHGGKQFRPAARSPRLGVAIIVMYGLTATLLPLLGLAAVALSPYWSGQIDLGKLTLDNFRVALETPSIQSAIETTLVVSLVSVACALVLGFLISSIIYDKRGGAFIQTVCDGIVTIPLAIPAVVFGIAFLLTYSHWPFILYGTKWVMILVYITIVIPFSTRMQLSGMISLGRTYHEASRSSGAGAIRTAVRIMFPLMLPTFIAVSSLMFILLSHEFAASLFVRAPTVQVMGTILYDYYSRGSYPVAASVALIMFAITGAGVTLALLVGGSDVFGKLS